jgi:hypothetical protein
MTLHEALYLWVGLTIGTFLGVGVFGLFTRKKAADAGDVLAALIEIRATFQTVDADFVYWAPPRTFDMNGIIARADIAITHATEGRPDE